MCWVVDVFGLFEGSVVGFGMSVMVCMFVVLVVVWCVLLVCKGWDIDEDGLIGVLEVKVVIFVFVYIMVKKVLCVFGFGMKCIVVVLVDMYGWIDLV